MRKIDAFHGSRGGTILEFGLVAALLTAAFTFSMPGLGTQAIGSLSNMVADLHAS
jgi:hypothetical protein